jgi:serine/threonine protein kinase
LSDKYSQLANDNNKNKAKELSKSFLNIYKDVKIDSNAKRSQSQDYSKIFNSALLYFSYLDSCKQFVNYLIKLENQLYRDNQTIKCTDEAAEALKNSSAIKWIREEINLMNNEGHVSPESLVTRLQEKNSHIFKPKTDFITDFTSSDVDTRYSVSKLINSKTSLELHNTKNINKFIVLMDNLFERVLSIPCIKFPVLVLKQFNLPKIEKDFFSIIQELIGIYQIENSIKSNSNKNELLFKEVAEHIVNSKNNLDKKLVSSFGMTEKHFVIEKLTTFSIVEDESYEMSDNLTQLNQSAILSFSQHKPLNDYLQYLDKLWLQKTSRKNSKPILKESLDKIANEQIKDFLNLNFDECLKRIYLYFIQKSSSDYQLATIQKELLKNIGVTSIENLKGELFSEVKQACISFDNKNEIPLESAFTFANNWSSFNERKSAENELFTRAFLRLIISLDDYKSLHESNKFKVAVEQELCCLYRELFNHYLLGESLGDDFKKAIEFKYDEYLKDIFSVFRIWFMFLISQKVFLQQKESFDNFVFNYFTMFINHRKKPSSTDAFIYGKQKNENSHNERIEITENRDTQVPKIKTDESINESLIKYIDTKTIKFDVTEKVKDVLKTNGVSLWSFISLTSTEQLSKLWESEIGFDTKELIAFSLIQDFLNSAQKSLKEKDKIPQYLNSRSEFQKYIKNQWRNNFFRKIQNQTFPKIIFNFNKSFEDKLKDKIEVLSNLHSVNDERYLIGSQLGQGAFGVVYKARDLMFNTTVAIKLIPHWFKSEEVSKRLIQEASIMRNSQHENVVTVYDLVKLPAHKLIPETNCKINHLDIFEESEDVFALIMEEVNNGLTLDEYMQKPGDFSIVHSLCQALESVHKNGVIHGDIKPENILIDKNGVPKLTDFGIATEKGIDAIGASNLLFSSPSSINSGECTIQDDIYSLGMMSIFVLSPDIKVLFHGTCRSKAPEIRNELYCSLLKFFIYQYYDLEKHKNFKLEFLEKYKNKIIQLDWYVDFDEDNFKTTNIAIAKVMHEINSYFWSYELRLPYLHTVLRALSHSMEQSIIYDLLEILPESSELKRVNTFFEKINSADLFSLFLVQCNNDNPIMPSTSIQFYGREISSKDINNLLDESNFMQSYETIFNDKNSPKIKILHTINDEGTKDEERIFLWMSKDKGPVFSNFNTGDFSSRVIRLSFAFKKFTTTHLEVISYLKCIRNKQEHIHITLNVLEKLMLEHRDTERKFSIPFMHELSIKFISCELGANVLKKPIVLKDLLVELNCIMNRNLQSIEAVSPITERRMAEVYLNRDLFVTHGYKVLEDPDWNEDEKVRQWEHLINKTLTSWKKSGFEKRDKDLTYVNVFHDFLLSDKSLEILSEIKGGIEKYALSESFGVLLNEFELLEETLAKDWEFQLHQEYLNFGK